MRRRTLILIGLLTLCSLWVPGCGGKSEPKKSPEEEELAQFLESKSIKDKDKELKFVFFDMVKTDSADFPYEAKVTCEVTRSNVKRRLFARCEYRAGKWEFAKGTDAELLPK